MSVMCSSKPSVMGEDQPDDRDDQSDDDDWFGDHGWFV